MDKVFLIIQREYLSRVKKRSFIIMTLLAPLGFAAFMLVTILLSSGTDSKKRIAVIDESGYFKNELTDSEYLYFKFEDTTLSYLQLVYQNMEYDGILYIPEIENPNNPKGIEYLSENQIGIKSKAFIENQLTEVMQEHQMEIAQIDKQVLKEINNINIDVKDKILGEEGEEDKEGNAAIATVLGMGMGGIMYMVIFIYGAMVMKGVAEEKKNRIIEVIISSVKPFQLMVGKIIGIGAVGLTQFLLWGVLISVIYFVMMLFFGADLQQAMEGMNEMNNADQMGQEKVAMIAEAFLNQNWLKIFVCFIFYFLGGYLIYGGLFAAIGAATSEEGENQSLTMVVTIPIVVSFVIMTRVVQEPDSAMAFWASIIPFSSPIVMPALIPFEPDLWQIIISMLTLIGGFILTTWIAAKIYRVSILLHGKKISIKEIGKWVFYSK